MKWAVTAALLLASAPVRADVGTAETRLLARDLATQGADAFDRGSFEEALDLFHRAGQMLNVPTISLMEGRCLARLGRWTEALDRFHVTGHTPLTADAPPPFAAAVQDATREAQDLEQRIPHLRLVADAQQVDANHATVSLDGNPVQTILLNVPQPMNPGEHQIKATVAGRDYYSTSIILYPQQSIDIQLPAPPVPAVPKAVAEVVAVPPVVEDSTSKTPSWLFPVGVGATAVGGLGALIAGILATNTKNSLNHDCSASGSTHVCDPEHSSRIAQLSTERGLFVAGLAVGLVGAGVTTYVLLHDAPSSQVALGVGPTNVSIHGVF